MKSNAKYLNRLCLALLVIIFHFPGIKISAQKIEGIYISSSDFSNNKLSLAAGKNKKTKIKLNELFYKSYITVKYCDSVYTLYKDSVFGYRDKSGISYRFFDKTIYPVLNQGEQILLYKKETDSGSPKSPQKVITYYFSKDSGSPVVPLTTANLEKAFTDNKTFKEFLEIHFRNDSELTEYDCANKIYKINRLLELSQ
ncbi:MAG TPA: hypothetical protein VN026_14335, partial [Bacteroidia bacterium]|nr:hypothetical protein [Bacteroidia bacterium]